jgi:AcrR family transcriptional regulator
MHARKDSALEALPSQLPSGRHGLSRRFVVRNQRERILAAVTQVVAEGDYAQATVADIVSTARLSRRTFYEHFADKAECFGAAYDAGVARIVSVVEEAWLAPGDWTERVRRALEAFVGLVVDEPQLVRLCLLEPPAVSPEVQRRRERRLRGFIESVTREGQRQAPPDVEVPPIAAELVIRGLYEIVKARLTEERPAALQEELPQLAYCVLLPFCGDRRASEAAAGVERARTAATVRIDRRAAIG